MSKLRHVRDGEPLRIPASAYNAFVDAARAHKAGELSGGAQPGQAGRQPGIVMVRNANPPPGEGEPSGDVDRFGILTITGVFPSPTQNADAFANGPAFAGMTPAPWLAAQDLELFAIAQAPIARTRYGPAMLAGVTPVKVEIVSAAHRRARSIIGDEEDGGDSTKLISCHSGPAEILWAEPGTGDRSAVVRLGPAAPPAYCRGLVKVDEAAGANHVTVRPANANWTEAEETTPDVKVYLWLKTGADDTAVRAHSRVLQDERVWYIDAGPEGDPPVATGVLIGRWMTPPVSGWLTGMYTTIDANGWLICDYLRAGG